MKKQIDRLIFHTERAIKQSPLRMKFSPPCYDEIGELELTEEDVKELKEFEELFDREYEEYARSEPVLTPQNTMYFGGGPHKKKLHFLNASHYRTDIQKTYAWAIAHDINVFLVNYTTPIGILALETLLDLRHAGESFRLYAIQTDLIKHRRSYRLIPEKDTEMIWMVSKCDYHFHRLTVLEMFEKISSKVKVRYNEDGLNISEDDFEGWDDE